MNAFKLLYSGVSKISNRVNNLVDINLKEQVVDIRMISDRMMSIKLVVTGLTLNIISVTH